MNREAIEKFCAESWDAAGELRRLQMLAPLLDAVTLLGYPDRVGAFAALALKPWAGIQPVCRVQVVGSMVLADPGIFLLLESVGQAA